MLDNVTIAVSRRALCGEGPVWHAPSNSVYWVDIVGGEILRSELDRDLRQLGTKVLRYPEMVGAVSPRSGGGLVAAVASGFVGLADDGSQTHRVDCLPEGVRMNDAKVDPAGRYWSGSCAYDFTAGAGGLWVLDENWEATLVLDGLTLPNGLGWSPDGRTFYLVETQARQLLAFPFDPATSKLTPTPTVLVDAQAFDGLPDGLAVDSRGHLWVAEYSGSALQEFTPDGDQVRRIAIPTPQPTSCAFIGPDLDHLWVTSAAADLDEGTWPEAGSIFQVTGHGAAGLPIPPFGG
ncbi:SMP-30/gluconolactonase/LRE family protein [Tessaracoccus sp. OS52]|uniref:SMP-30/gluconolactonase/LRE family protein n=1 Tax=Tessaracoccus sp. OS52 TaxID=2886691 RepID=UPI001D109566|nr:SMP-30/gluconolactonase/LRE family protein [Tessaracoccus sp. OS52]MCC2591841.1 SMP-30/gluconolactonase/LRE family protein [Tessaracoccus sp. OS52]